MTWEDVLKRKDIIGGELISSDDEYTYRGPIKDIEMKKGVVRIKLLWVARKSLKKLGKSWKNWHVTRALISAENNPPKDLGKGLIGFNITPKSCSIIHPKGYDKLDPAKVKGLKIKS